jgi:multidrug efflux pump subunit AcrB
MNSVASPLRIILIFATVVIVAIFVTPRLSLDLMTSAKSTEVNITFYLSNSSPDVVEQQATALLENAFSQLSQLKNIQSFSRYNSGQISLTFDKTADMQIKQMEVSALIHRTFAHLPPGTSYPAISASLNGDYNKYNTPFIIFSISAPLQPFQIKRTVEAAYYKTLSGIPGISRMMVTGPENTQLTIEYDIDKCQAYHINPVILGGILKKNIATTHLGSIKGQDGNAFFLQIQSSVYNETDIENLLLPTSSGSFIHLKDIATVIKEERETSDYYRINGKNSVNLYITAREGENRITLANKIKTIVNQTAKDLPKGFEVRLERDDAQSLIIEMYRDYKHVAISLGVLLIFVLVIYRAWRPVFILVIGLLMNIALIIIITWLFNISIHLYTVSGVAIAFGIMISNAIVMMDHYFQSRTRKAFLSLLSTTLITMASLIVMLHISENDSHLSDLSGVMISALTASLLVALWFTPAIYELFNEKSRPLKKGMFSSFLNRKRNFILYTRYYWVTSFLAKYKKLFFTSLVLLFGLPLFMLPAKWEGDKWYNDLYNNSLGSDKYKEDIKPVVDKLTGGTFRLFVNNISGNAGYREATETKLYVNGELPYGSTGEQLNTIFKDFETYLQTVPGIDKYVTRVFSGQLGNIEISFKKGYNNLPYQLKSRLVARSMDWGGVDWTIVGVGIGFSNTSSEENPSFKVNLLGYNYDELNKQVYLLATKLKMHKRVQNITINEKKEGDDKTAKEFTLELDSKKMALLQTNKFEILSHINALSRPSRPQLYIPLENKYYPVLLKEKNASVYSNYTLMNEPLVVSNTKSVRIKELGILDTLATLGIIRKINRQYVQTLSFDFLGAPQFGSNYLDEVLEDMRKEMPLGFSVDRKENEGREPETSKYQYSLLLLMAIIAYFISSIQFGNLYQPLIIAVSIPVSFIGSFLMFAMNDFYFDQGGQVAFILLAGLSVSAVIHIVNDFNIVKKENKSKNVLNKLIIKVVIKKVYAILFATVAVCCGLIPFLMEGTDEVFWFSLAAVITGGMLASLFAVFVVVPVLLWK